MRMWIVNPALLCRLHLLGERCEIHKYKHNFEKRHCTTGHIDQVFPLQMKLRHDALALKLVQRGYNHNSPYEAPGEVLKAVPNIPATLQKSSDLQDLCRRCPACAARIRGKRIIGDNKILEHH